MACNTNDYFDRLIYRLSFSIFRRIFLKFKLENHEKSGTSCSG